MKNENDDLFYRAPWPTLCTDCGKEIAKFVVEREDLEVFTTYCPHRFTLAILYAGQIEGSRGIVRWDVQGPLSQPEAVEIMRKMAPYAASMENLDKPRLQ